MSIPCVNKIICRCNNRTTLEKISEWLQKNSREFTDIEANDTETISLSIDHDFGFPAQMMQQMTREVRDEPTLVISVVTHDQSQEYVAHHEYSRNEWHCRYENCRHPQCEKINSHIEV